MEQQSLLKHPAQILSALSSRYISNDLLEKLAGVSYHPDLRVSFNLQGTTETSASIDDEAMLIAEGTYLLGLFDECRLKAGKEFYNSMFSLFDSPEWLETNITISIDEKDDDAVIANWARNLALLARAHYHGGNAFVRTWQVLSFTRTGSAGLTGLPNLGQTWSFNGADGNYLSTILTIKSGLTRCKIRLCNWENNSDYPEASLVTEGDGSYILFYDCSTAKYRSTFVAYILALFDALHTSAEIWRDRIDKRSLTENSDPIPFGTTPLENAPVTQMPPIALSSFDPSPPKDLVARIVQAVGEGARDKSAVEVGIQELLQECGLTESVWWQGDSRNALSVPIGPRGANEIQEMELGLGLAHHALIVGRPGSGKTNLMHVIIIALALKYAPDELELYLIDFKKGVGFKSYAEHCLPHARVIAIESEREFGLSVLRGIDAELSRRGELFRGAGGSEKLSEYRNRTGAKLPRIVLMADEFQEFFTEEDNLAQEAHLLLDRIIRQGRAFGIHTILATQTLAGTYGLNRSTMDQVSVRIALQCSDADSRIILGDDNPAARFLSRPGECIYNSENGLIQSNKLFQVALIKDHDKEAILSQISKQGSDLSLSRAVVFEGHLPASIEDCKGLSIKGTDGPTASRTRVNAFLGEPVAIKPTTSVSWKRQSGSNLAIVTRDEAQGLGVLANGVLTTAMQQRAGECRFVIADFSSNVTEDKPFFEAFADETPHDVVSLTRRNLPPELKKLNDEVISRHSDHAGKGSEIYLVIAGIQRARELRKADDDFSNDSPSDHLLTIVKDGPEVGVHTLLWSDTLSNLVRIVGRRAVSEFSYRVSGVLSADDSINFIESTAASKIDRPYRMILFNEDRPEMLEKFRPFTVPSHEWLVNVSRQKGSVE